MSMGRSSVRVAALVALVVVVGMWARAMPARAALSEAECHAERVLGLNACKAVLDGAQPSPQCCERVRVTPWECVCPLVTPWRAPLINVNRAVRLIEGCGRRVPRHFKCGSITTP